MISDNEDATVSATTSTSNNKQSVDDDNDNDNNVDEDDDDDDDEDDEIELNMRTMSGTVRQLTPSKQPSIAVLRGSPVVRANKFSMVKETNLEHNDQYRFILNCTIANADQTSDWRSGSRFRASKCQCRSTTIASKTSRCEEGIM